MQSLDIDSIPPQLLEQFNKLFPMCGESFARELADTTVLASTTWGSSALRYGVRKVDHAPIILIETQEGDHFAFLPEGSA